MGSESFHVPLRPTSWEKLAAKALNPKPQGGSCFPSTRWMCLVIGFAALLMALACTVPDAAPTSQNAPPAPMPEPTLAPPPTPTVEQALKAFILCERLRLNEETYWGISPSTLQNLDPRFSGTLEPGDYIRILTPESNNGALRVKVYPHDLRSVSSESNDQVWIDWDILVLQPEYRFDQLVFTCED